MERDIYFGIRLQGNIMGGLMSVNNKFSNEDIREFIEDKIVFSLAVNKIKDLKERLEFMFNYMGGNSSIKKSQYDIFVGESEKSLKEWEDSLKEKKENKKEDSKDKIIKSIDELMAGLVKEGKKSEDDIRELYSIVKEIKEKKDDSRMFAMLNIKFITKLEGLV